MTGFLASIVEAYGELRVNKGRVLLSLIGVALSVFAMTGVLGAGGMLSGALQQSLERDMGRSAVLQLQPTGTVNDAGEARRRDDAVLQTLDRLGMTQRSRTAQVSMRVQTRNGVFPVDVNAVDPSWADMYRIRPALGRWLARSDEDRLAPAIVVDDELYERLGRPPLGTATLVSYGVSPSGGSGTTGGAAGHRVEMVVVGVLPHRPGEEPDGMLTAFVPSGALAQVPGAESAVLQRSYVAWVPPEVADEATSQLRAQLRTVPGGPIEAQSMGLSLEDMGFDKVTWAIAAVAGVVLLLGAMGLVNISLVTVRHRMREIGIRRSYGATGARIFVGVLMESVVATTVAGLIGVTAAVALVRAPFVQRWFAQTGLVDLPPFPVSAVVTGLLAAIGVGALAGIVPALIATRVKVIDAIRA
ncbi:ABC transporter permease [Mobilicoccus pelagius]|uniref:Putative ABC transporter permease protein n=1 Tax=Mobilicoccus pelagius NBRC 104925 TaxID=1089455 RepID=H5UP31_9MICO|nr:ABC transporter permease [Mobilicoccus pelagius]GAB47489.1 putative ABC transporter permease protein [Mobilicoccus pelagius NBRC 104925]